MQLTKRNPTDELITNHTDIYSFQMRMQGDFPNNYLGVHVGGHFWVGGDPGKSSSLPSKTPAKPKSVTKTLS